MATARLIRTVQFSAAHRYYRPEWSPERNREVFGACANEHGHGHTYRCAVTLQGEIDDTTSMVMNLSDVDALLKDEVVDPLDHQHLNHVVRAFADGTAIPTAEALAVHVWDRLQARLPEGIDLVSVRIEEDDTLSAEYAGP